MIQTLSLVENEALELALSAAEASTFESDDMQVFVSR
jgi:hypothetical protein